METDFSSKVGSVEGSWLGVGSCLRASGWAVFEGSSKTGGWCPGVGGSCRTLGCCLGVPAFGGGGRLTLGLLGGSWDFCSKVGSVVGSWLGLGSRLRVSGWGNFGEGPSACIGVAACSVEGCSKMGDCCMVVGGSISLGNFCLGAAGLGGGGRLMLGFLRTC